MEASDEKMAFDAMMNDLEQDSSDDDEITNIDSKNITINKTKKYTSNLKINNNFNNNFYDGTKTDEFNYEATSNFRASPNYGTNGNGGNVLKSYNAPLQNKAEPKIIQNIKYNNTHKMTKDELAIEEFGNSSKSISNSNDDNTRSMDDISVMKRWLSRPCSPGDPPVLCYVERDKSGFNMINHVYKCYLETSSGSGKFIMAARKKTKTKTSYYLISMDELAEDRGSETVLGKVRGNSIGSQYLITDAGLAPEKSVLPSMIRKELGVVRFQFDSGGPSRVEAWVPTVNASGVASVWQSTNDELDMETHIENNETNTLISMQNKKPKWDDAHGGHVLNFQGRVTESSVKNFQLIVIEDGANEDVVLQFGRTGKNVFSMDVAYPLSPLQAFGFCISCMDGKIADRKGYEYIRKLTGSIDNESSGKNNSNRGSLSGSKGIASSIIENIPTGKYLRDKISRVF